MDVDHPPLSVAQTVLKDVAPELAEPVHLFLHGKAPRMRPVPTVAGASFTLRQLHDDLEAAVTRRRDRDHVSILAAAVRLQAVTLYETLYRHYVDQG